MQVEFFLQQAQRAPQHYPPAFDFIRQALPACTPCYVLCTHCAWMLGNALLHLCTG